jgi:hypothetical protein
MTNKASNVRLVAMLGQRVRRFHLLYNVQNKDLKGHMPLNLGVLRGDKDTPIDGDLDFINQFLLTLQDGIEQFDRKMQVFSKKTENIRIISMMVNYWDFHIVPYLKDIDPQWSQHISFISRVITDASVYGYYGYDHDDDEDYCHDDFDHLQNNWNSFVEWVIHQVDVMLEECNNDS